MIETVLGPIAAEALGVVSTNEHVATDARQLQRPTREGGTLEGPMRPEILGDLRWSWMSLADNLTLDDADTAVAELGTARADSLRTIVEATSFGMGPDPAVLPDISRRSGIQIVAAYGSYIDKTLPVAWRALEETAMEKAFRTAVIDAVPGTGFRAGLLGLLGTSAEITPAELRALRAAGRVAGEIGVPVSIRLDGSARRGPEVIDVLTDQGMRADRILFCNIDKTLDLSYVRDISDSGAVVEFAFGSEHHFADGARDHSDTERVAFLLSLLDARPDAAVTLSCSVWTKGQLTRHGGMGYGHVVRRIAPALQRQGIGAQRVERMLVSEPARLLDRN